MANVTITAANFLPSANAIYLSGICIAGETIAAGEVVYLKAADSRFWKAVATSAAASTAVGFAANGAAAGQRLLVVSSDTAAACGTVLTGIGYAFGMSATSAGKLCDIEDTNGIGGTYSNFIGQSVTSSTLRFDLSKRNAGLA